MLLPHHRHLQTQYTITEQLFSYNYTLSIFVVWLVLLVAPATSEEALRYANEMGRLPVGAKIAAMGDAGVALPQRASSALWNAASPGYFDKYEVSAEGADLYQHLSQQGCFTGGIPLKKMSGIAINYIPFYSGLIPRYDSIPETTGNNGLTEYTPHGYFRNFQHLLNIAYARRYTFNLPRFGATELPLPCEISAGVNCKTYVQTMNPDGNYHMGLGYNADAGVIVRIGMDYHLSTREISRQLFLAAAVRDMLPSDILWIYHANDVWMYSPDAYRERFTYAQYYGIAFKDQSGDLPFNWTAALALHKEYAVSYHAGVEVELLNRVSFRAGLSDKIPTLGAGIRYNRFYADYAFRFDAVALSLVRLTVGMYLF